MKKIWILLLFALANTALVNAQEKYHFTFNTKQDKDTTVVYDAHGNVVLLYGKDIFTYQQTPIKIAKDKKNLVFSSPDGELGRVASKKYKRIYLADSSMYVLKSGKRKLSYKKAGRACANAEYSYNSHPFFVDSKVYVEMSVDTPDSFLTPFLFHGVLAHIKGTQMSEELIWWSSFPYFM